MSTSKKIAVIGAGPMGLAVAYQLALDGYAPVVFEADDRVGGMTASFDFGGTLIERYYHFHCTSDSAFLEMLSELGIEDKMCWKETRMGYWFQNRLQPWGNPQALLKFKGLSLAAKFRYGLHAFACVRRNDWQPLDGLEATAWIKKWVGADAWDVLWRRLFEYKFYEHATGLSAAWIWSRVRRIGRSRYSLMREKLGCLEGGSSTLLSALETRIRELGGDIRLSCPVEKIHIMEDAIKSVKTTSGMQDFDTVISTVPLPFVPRMIPDLPADILQAYAALKNVAVVCVIVKLKKPLTENFWLNVNDPQMDIPGLVEYTNLRALDQHIVYVPFYIPAEHPKYADSNETYINKAKKYIRTINPEISEDDFVDARASRYRYAQPVCGPNFLRHLPPVKLPVKGLWVADTSHYYPEDRGISESIGFGRNLARQAMA